MLVKVKLHGTGVRGDAYRANLPHYVLVHGNITQGYALVHLDDNAHGLSDEDLKDESVEETTEGLLYHDLSDEIRDKIHAHFDERYQDSKQTFRVERP